MDEKELLNMLFPTIGGEDNVSRVQLKEGTVHVSLKDRSLADLNALAELSSVTGVEENRGRLKISVKGIQYKEEKQMAKLNYAELAGQIIDLVGGKENVTSVTHCVTRLRLVLADGAKADLDKIKALPGVINALVSAGQHQIVLGPIVEDVYAETVKITGMGTLAEGAPAPKEKMTVGKAAKSALDTLVACFVPSLKVIAGAGMLKALVALLSNYGILAADSGTYMLLNTIGDSVFFFLPFFVGLNASKKMGVNPGLGLVLAAILLHPNFRALIDAEESIKFLGITVPALDYSAQCIPVIFGVWMMKYVDAFFSKHCPKVVSIFLPSMLDLMIVAPVMLLVVGPISIALNNAILAACGVMMNWGWIAVGLNSLFFPLMVLTGTHNAATPLIVMMMFGPMGGDPIFLVSGLAVNIAQAGAACAVACKTKNKTLRSTGFSATVSALLGITEPALYGVNLRMKKPFIGMMLGAFVGGCYCGMMKLVAHVFATPSILTFALLKPDGGSVWAAFSAVLVSFAAAFVITWLLGFEDLPADAE